MDYILKDSKTFQMYVMIDLYYAGLQNIQDELSKRNKRTPIEIMIDKVSGFEKKQTKELIIYAISFVKKIIKLKKKIKADYSNDEKMLNELLILNN